MNWCFALINNKLAEVFFEKKGKSRKFLGHAFVKESDYKTKKEKAWIKSDTTNVQLIYRNGKYRRIIKPTKSIKRFSIIS